MKKQLEKSRVKMEQQAKSDKSEFLTRTSGRRLRATNQVVSYEEESLKSPPSKRKCMPASAADASANRTDLSPHVVRYLEKMYDANKFLKDKQIEQISRETSMSAGKIREWLKQRSLRSNMETGSENTENRRRSRKILDK